MMSVAQNNSKEQCNITNAVVPWIVLAIMVFSKSKSLVWLLKVMQVAGVTAREKLAVAPTTSIKNVNCNVTHRQNSSLTKAHQSTYFWLQDMFTCTSWVGKEWCCGPVQQMTDCFCCVQLWMSQVSYKPMKNLKWSISQVELMNSFLFGILHYLSQWVSRIASHPCEASIKYCFANQITHWQVKWG